MPTTRTENREVETQEILLARWDIEDDLIQWGDLEDDTALVSSWNNTDWTPRPTI